MRQVALEDLPARALELVDHAVRRGRPDQRKQHGAPRLHGLGQLLHEPIVDAHVREGAGNRAGRRADHHAQEGVEEQEADQRAPEAAGDGAGAGRADGLVQPDLALVVLHGDDGVLDVDQVVLLHLAQHQPDFLGLVGIVVADRDEGAHRFLLHAENRVRDAMRTQRYLSTQSGEPPRGDWTRRIT
jgi:hypothetical protein